MGGALFADSFLCNMKKILFVEDDLILKRVYLKALEAAGFEVKHVADGEAGLQILQVYQPDLILLDLMLPRISGIELLTVIRSTPEMRFLPVIVFSNAFREDVRAEVQALGANRLLSKSEYVPRQVIQIIHELLPGTQREQAAAVSDPELVAELRARAPELLNNCRSLIQEINREENPEHRLVSFRGLRVPVSGLANLASALGLKAYAYFCEAFTALIGECSGTPAQLTPSILRTTTQAMDFLAEAFEGELKFEGIGRLTFNLLIVDDDSISRRGIQLALSKIKQEGIECTGATEAISLCQNRAFDLIFLDVEMPGQNGFDVCGQLRREGANRATPVIFVSRHTDLQMRAQSMLSGGTDFIAKPFQFMELAVKSLQHLLRSQLR